jgi:ribose transport system ATP-binding protein
MSDDNNILQLRGVEKTFPNGTVALRGVDLDVEKGRVHGLLGANGAGKSTLIKILSGAYKASAGEILWRGAPVRWDSPKAANDMGVATIHQHIPLAPPLSVLENVFLGERGLWRRSAAIRRRYEELCERIGHRIDPDALVGDLSIGERQMVAIFQALGTGADLIVMDEPTASLAAKERELVYATVRRLSKGEGKAILFVSHFLDEVMALTERVTVLRDGRAVLRAETADLDEDRIAEAIVGKELAAIERNAGRRPAHPSAADRPPLLELRNVGSPGRLEPVSLRLAPGEVVGLAGLLGSGRSELLHAIFGADRDATGEVLVEGAPVGRSPAAAVGAGMGLVPEDRSAQAIIPNFEIWRNVSLPALHGVSALGALPVASRERERGWAAIRRLGIKANSPEILVSELSGGNAQKVTIARWLFTDVKVFLLDEPTAGIDVGAKADILLLVRELAEAGKAVIVVSSDFEELLPVCDRILIMRDGRIVAERDAFDTTEHDLLLLAGGQGSSPEVAAHHDRQGARAGT